MKTSRLLSLSLLSSGLALSLASARADNPSTPPAPPSSDTGPGAGPQTPPPTPPHHRHRGAFVLGELTEKLGLTPDQQKTVGAIIADCDGQLKALRQDDSIAREDKRAKMKSIIETTRGQIRAALTPDQQKIFDTLPAHAEHGGEAPSPTPTPTS